MASNRGERFLMRQRGAGARALLGDFSFDIEIPGVSRSPLKSVASGRQRKTPQASRPQPSTKKTPQPAVLLPRRSTRRTPAATRRLQSPNVNVDGDGLVQATSVDVQGSVVKKRKVSTTVTLVGTPRPRGLVLPERLERAVEAGTETPVAPAAQAPIEQQDRNVRQQAAPMEAAVPPKSTGKKRKKRISIGQQSRKRIKRVSPTGGQTGTVPAAAPLPSNRAQETETSSPADDDTRTEAVPDSPTRTSSGQKPKRKKRKAVGMPAKVRKKPVRAAGVSVGHQSNPNSSSKTSERAMRHALGSERRAPTGLAPLREEQEQGKAEQPEELEEPDQKNRDVSSCPTQPIAPAKRRGRPKKVRAEEPLRETMEPTEESTRKTRKPRIQKTSSQEKLKKAPERAPKQAPKKVPKQAAKQGTIPITVHRLTRTRALLPADGDDKAQAGPGPFPKKSGPNAIDVLGQICREIISNTIDNLNADGPPERSKGPTAAERKRKKKAVEMFGDELEKRLFQMTEALDNNYALSVRLRQAKREKALVADELLELRRQRREVAVEMDAARAGHRRAAEVAQRDVELNAMLHDIELAVRRGRAGQSDVEDPKPVGLELRLRETAAEISSAGGSLGLLDRVKSFNAFLESALEVL